MPNRFRVVIALMQILAVSAFGQSKKPALEYRISVGISGQFDVLDQEDRAFTVNTNIHGNGANDEGPGVPLIFNIYCSSLELGLMYEPVIRYDVVIPGTYFYRNGVPPTPAKYGIFADHHFSLRHNFKFPRLLFRWLNKDGKRKYLGAGVSLMSPGLSYKYDWYMIDAKTQKESTGSTVDMSFNGIHFLIGFPVYKNFFLEAKLIRVPFGQRMFEYYQDANLLQVKALYEIRFK